jgi:hypothetical protein
VVDLVERMYEDEDRSTEFEGEFGEDTWNGEEVDEVDTVAKQHYVKKGQKRGFESNNDEDNNYNDEDDDGEGEWVSCGMKEHESGPGRYCFLCRFSTFDQPNDEVRTKMMALEERVLRSTTSSVAYKVQDVYDLYERDIRSTLTRIGCPEWSKKTIEEHVLGLHGSDVPKMKTEHRSRVGVMMHALGEHAIVRSRKTGKTKPQLAVMKLYLKFGCHLEKDIAAD